MRQLAQVRARVVQLGDLVVRALKHHAPTADRRRACGRWARRPITTSPLRRRSVSPVAQVVGIELGPDRRDGGPRRHVAAVGVARGHGVAA